MGLFDVHAHLTDKRFAEDEALVLDRASAAGLTTIVSNGLNPRDNAAVLALAARAPLVKPALGLYPVDAVLPEMLAMGLPYPRDEAAPPPSAEEAVGWLEDHVGQAFAIGEVGLDRHWVPEPLWAAQEAVFRRLVRLAMQADKALILHSRKAEARTLEILVEEGARRVVWHCFSGKLKLGQAIAAQGHWLSLPANISRAGSFSRLAMAVPQDRLLLETDCPYLGPRPGERNEPANVAETAAHLQAAWGLDAPSLQDRLERNFQAVFGVSP